MLADYKVCFFRRLEDGMKAMEEMILKEGKVLPGGVLKVGSFLNQKIDTSFLKEMGEEVERLFRGEEITKILTVEASGIAFAVSAGMTMNVPVLFAKKHRTSNVDGDAYATTVHSFTHDQNFNIMVSKEYLIEGDRILIVDDFLANGNALRGLIDIVHMAGADVVGAVVAIEKCFQGGGDALRKDGLRVEALASIESMEKGEITFRR